MWLTRDFWSNVRVPAIMYDNIPNVFFTGLIWWYPSAARYRPGKAFRDARVLSYRVTHEFFHFQASYRTACEWWSGPESVLARFHFSRTFPLCKSSPARLPATLKQSRPSPVPLSPAIQSFPSHSQRKWSNLSIGFGCARILEAIDLAV